ncbi:MAG TPA: methyl-accepting chemotaxis protein [Paraburkholderia sp.]|nr:methyl-accepting chemotaxis protein [Paraburkholderia sp.]
MFSHISIRTRINGVLVFLGAMLVIVGTLGHLGMQQSNEALQDAYANTLDSAISIGNANLNLTIVRTTLDRALLHPEAPGVDELVTRAQSYLSISQRAWQHYQSLPKAPEEAALATQVNAARQAFVDRAILPMMDDIRKGDHAGADQVAMTVVPPISVELSKASNALDHYHTLLGAQNYASAQSTFHLFRAITWGGVIVALVAALTCAVNLHRAIGRPISAALEHFDHISRGDLTRPIHVHANDEMGRLVGGMASMQDKLITTVREVTSSAHSIGTATQEIASGNTDLSQRTEEQAAALQETAASMEELAQTIKQNADNARQATALAGTASNAAADSADVVKQVIGTMEQIDASSQKISEIIGVIEGIAFQTNILALNAAVEAARAGEHGKGFAVVASEVRALAQRSAVAAKEISDLIRSSVGNVNAGSHLAGEAGERMAQVLVSIRRVSHVINEIAAASAEQSEGVEQVTGAVSQMDEVAQQNAALVEQAAAAASSLAEQTTALTKAVSFFRIHATLTDNDTRSPGA